MLTCLRLSSSSLFTGSSADTPSPTESCPSSPTHWWTWSSELVRLTFARSQSLAVASVFNIWRFGPLCVLYLCQAFFFPSITDVSWCVVLCCCCCCPGAVKVTPAHDHTDFLLSQKHSLPRLTVIRGDGTMTPPCGQWLEVQKGKRNHAKYRSQYVLLMCVYLLN